uniref:NADH dehydrogenase subunit 5 n=1 Tax=Latona dysoni TaxID=3246695 RepID=UPI002114615B|nr:NADH dehydrogenase subunit 5 [Donax dysoni]UTM92215.1 NADH dehydrogenase subunit 5 [Donax dysoni]
MSNTFKIYSYYSLLLVFLLWSLYFVLNFVLVGGSLIVELDLLSGSVLHLNVPFVLDNYSVVFCFVVLMISSSVMLYNGFYMDGEYYYNRFCKLVLLFVLSMLFLVFIPNLLGLMVGWDGLGLTSYLLVIYYQDKRSLGSGTLTVLSNRVGDVLFFMGISLASGMSVWGFNDLSFVVVGSVLCGSIVVGCMTKSAQVPFSAWLPAAMAAPSPVSALVHSSTLVTAGVYVLVRFSGSIMSGWYVFLGLISCMTMLMAAFSAVFEPDVKKVVALSTLSQLGVMMLAVSVGSISVCFFHLVSHALFKALMFLCVGAVIHYSGIQDLRYLGGFMYKNPIVMGWLIIACLSLSGFPFLSGFYSKDLVIESFMSEGVNILLGLMVLISTCLTAFYSGLMVFSVSKSCMVFPGMGDMISNSYVIIPCFVLGVGALFGGLIMQSMILSFNSIFILQGVVKLLPIMCVMVGLVLLVLMVFTTNALVYMDLSYLSNKGLSYGLIEFMVGKMWFLPLLSSDLFSNEVLFNSDKVKEVVEDGYLESYLGGEGVWMVNSTLSEKYMGSQMDSIGINFLKGLVVIFIILLCWI